MFWLVPLLTPVVPRSSWEAGEPRASICPRWVRGTRPKGSGSDGDGPVELTERFSDKHFQLFSVFGSASKGFLPGSASLANRDQMNRSHKYLARSVAEREL